ncbi:hypothetical protein MHYP_G00029300 [Metynnis hypsauchen]
MGGGGCVVGFQPVNVQELRGSPNDPRHSECGGHAMRQNWSVGHWDGYCSSGRAEGALGLPRGPSASATGVPPVAVDTAKA